MVIFLDWLNCHNITAPGHNQSSAHCNSMQASFSGLSLSGKPCRRHQQFECHQSDAFHILLLVFVSTCMHGGARNCATHLSKKSNWEQENVPGWIWIRMDRVLHLFCLLDGPFGPRAGLVRPESPQHVWNIPRIGCTEPATVTRFDRINRRMLKK